MPEPMSFVKALKHYFELDGSTMIREFKELTDEDKADFRKMLADAGYVITD